MITLVVVSTTTQTSLKMPKYFHLKTLKLTTLWGKGPTERLYSTGCRVFFVNLILLQVYRGYIKYPSYKVEVAIKTCKRSNGYDDIEREARVFMKLKERNMNIVNLLGGASNS